MQDLALLSDGKIGGSDGLGKRSKQVLVEMGLFSTCKKGWVGFG